LGAVATGFEHAVLAQQTDVPLQRRIIEGMNVPEGPMLQKVLAAQGPERRASIEHDIEQEQLIVGQPGRTTPIWLITHFLAANSAPPNSVSTRKCFSQNTRRQGHVNRSRALLTSRKFRASNPCAAQRKENAEKIYMGERGTPYGAPRRLSTSRAVATSVSGLNGLSITRESTIP
jgi:hypothetical protein